MTLKDRFCSTVMALLIFYAMASNAMAADYSFTTDAPQDYYGDTSYEDIYGSQYNYGGPNVVDYQIPELEYGILSTTQTGIMEPSILRGLQPSVATMEGAGGYGISADGATEIYGGGLYTAPEFSGLSLTSTSQQPAITSVDGLEREDGSIGTLEIPSLGISMKVWEGETNASMKKGLGHYTSTSAWDGNVGMCGHNRGSKHVIGSIKDLQQGDTIAYTTKLGTRTYQVVTVETIDNSDWSYLQSTTDNRLTITTCLADHPESRVCVQAVEILG